MHRTWFATSLLAALTFSGAALASEPSAYGLATHAVMRGTLNDAEHPVVKSAVYFAEDDGSPTVEQMTREQMMAELQKMQAEGPPSLVGPIVLTSIGGAMLITGIVLFQVLVISGAYYDAALAVGAVLGLGLIIAGAVMLAIGIVRVVRSSIARGHYNSRLDDINRRLSGNVAPVPGGGDVPPPPPPADEVPPPPPPGAIWNIPQTSIVVASF